MNGPLSERVQAPFSDFSEQPCCDFVLGSGSDAAAASSLSDMLNYIFLVFYMLIFPIFYEIMYQEGISFDFGKSRGGGVF